MGVSDIFRSALGMQPAAAPTPSAAQAPSANLPDGSQSTLEAKPIDPNAPPPGSEKETSPLADYSKLFDNIVTPDKQKLPGLNADPAKLAEVAKTLDFTRSIPPELARKALAGDVGAFAQVINEALRQGFIASTQASSHLVDRQSAAVVDHVQQRLPDQLKNFQSRENLLADNPALKNPALSPLLSVIQAQLTQQFPQASAAEIADHARKYLSQAASVINSGNSAATAAANSSAANGYGGIVEKQRQQAENFDWGEWAVPSQTSQQPFSS